MRAACTDSVIEKVDESGEHNFHLYVRPKDPRAELWEGARSGVQAAEDVFNADTTGDVNELPKILPEILKRTKEVYTDLPQNLISRNILSRYLSGQEPSRTGGIATLFRDTQGLAVKPPRHMVKEHGHITRRSRKSRMQPGEPSGSGYPVA